MERNKPPPTKKTLVLLSVPTRPLTRPLLLVHDLCDVCDVCVQLDEYLSDDFLFPMTSRLSYASSPESDVDLSPEPRPSANGASASASNGAAAGDVEASPSGRLIKSCSDPSIATNVSSTHWISLRSKSQRPSCGDSRHRNQSLLRFLRFFYVFYVFLRFFKCFFTFLQGIFPGEIIYSRHQHSLHSRSNFFASHFDLLEVFVIVTPFVNGKSNFL